MEKRKVTEATFKAFEKTKQYKQALIEAEKSIERDHENGIFSEGDPNHTMYNDGYNYCTKEYKLFGYDQNEFLAISIDNHNAPYKMGAIKTKTAGNAIMINLLSLDQLAHKAHCEDNALAMAILDKLEDEVSEAVERATEKNDADYHYEVFDAVQAIECLLNDHWYKVEETKLTKDQIIYMIQHLHEDTSPYNNHVKLWKYKGSDVWRLEVSAGQYGEQQESIKFNAAGFKDAQKQAVEDILSMIKKGLQLNINN